MAEPTPEEIDNFIHRWKKSGGHERGAGQHFLLELCALLGLPQPDPPREENSHNSHNSYTFEHVVTRRKPDGTTAPNWIDLYKAGAFVLETKQGVNPARDKADADGRPPPSARARRPASPPSPTSWRPSAASGNCNSFQVSCPRERSPALRHANQFGKPGR